MDIVYYMICAITLSWLITDILHNRANLYFNMLLGLVAAFLVGFFVPPYLKIPTILAPFNMRTLSIILLGVMLLVIPFNLTTARRRR